MPSFSPRYHYGYLMNIEKAVQLILIHDPLVREDATAAGVLQYVDPLLTRVVSWVARQVPLLGLHSGIVWFGSGHYSICWSLDPSIQPQTRTPEAAHQLRKFKKLVGLGGEPILMASREDGCDEPESYKTMEPPQFLLDWSLLSYINRCRAGEITLETLLAPLRELPDMQKMSLTKGERVSESREFQARPTRSQ